MLNIYITFSKCQSVAIFDAIADLNIVGYFASAAKQNTGFSAITV